MVKLILGVGNSRLLQYRCDRPGCGYTTFYKRNMIELCGHQFCRPKWDEEKKFGSNHPNTCHMRYFYVHKPAVYIMIRDATRRQNKGVK